MNISLRTFNKTIAAGEKVRIPIPNCTSIAFKSIAGIAVAFWRANEMVQPECYPWDGLCVQVKESFDTLELRNTTSADITPNIAFTDGSLFFSVGGGTPISPNNAIYSIGNCTLQTQKYPNMVPTNDISVSFWFKTSTNQENGILIEYSTWGTTYTWQIVLSYDSIRLGLDANGGEFLDQIFTYNDNVWHNIVACFCNNAVNPYIKLYIDGTNLQTVILPSNISYAQEDSLNILHRGDSSLKAIDVAMDELNFWDRILTDDEVTLLYNSGKGVYANVLNAPFNIGFCDGFHFDENYGMCKSINGKYADGIGYSFESGKVQK